MDKEMDERLQKFFAVTAASPVAITLWEIEAKGKNGCPRIRKIASLPKPRRRKKKFAEITEMSGQMLAVAKWLQLFNLQRLRSGRQERRLDKVSTCLWQGGTPPIVSLFLTEDEARECFASLDPKFCDPRWQENTKEVLSAIGENHPTFVICRKRWKHWKSRALVY